MLNEDFIYKQVTYIVWEELIESINIRIQCKVIDDVQADIANAIQPIQNITNRI